MPIAICRRASSEIIRTVDADTLAGANLYATNLSGANLTRADLPRANLTCANLYDANLYCADLTGANLCDANLTGANLTGANLTGADLTGANLCDANLTGANLYGANLHAARGVTDAGADARGLRFWCWRHPDGHPVYRASCREWTAYGDAWRHYGPAYASDGDPQECRARLLVLLLAARSAGWTTEQPIT